jgi:DNA segregation ATPase FtsK/SpoIIIE, S-DNA-T family
MSTSDPDRFDWDRYEHEVTKPGQPSAAGQPDTDPASSGAGRVLVDSPEAQRPGRGSLREATRRPIVPSWARSRQELVGRTRWAAGLAGHYGAYHATRSPKYAGRLAIRAPRGAGRVLRGLVRWLLDLEGEPVRAAVVRREDAEAYRHLSRQRDRRVRWRALVTTALLVALLVALAVVALAPSWARWAAMAILVGVLGVLGAPADRPRLLDTAVVIAQAPRLTSDMVSRALSVLGVAGITQALAKDPRGAITFPSPITRDGPGWRADVDLPPGVTVGDVVDRRDRLASGLRRPLGCVWPEGDPGVHEGRLILWVGDRDLSKAGPLRWKLAKTGQHDLFTPVPFGADPRGRGVAVPLVQHNVLIGSLPGQGKTSAVRVLACGAALDPTAQLWLHELKGSGDLDPLEPITHRYVSGIDDDAIGYAADSLSLLKTEVMRRAGALKQLPRQLCPDRRVTRQIADRRQLGLYPLACVIDECQNLFAHPQFGPKAGEDAEFIIKIGRAFGVSLILATQRPDKDSLPTGVSGNVSIRFCLKVAGQVENDMILGTSAYKNGLRATVFRPETDAGIGYLVGATAVPVVVRTAYLDGPATERIAARAHALRQAAGTLSGHALGQAPQEPSTRPERLLGDVLGVVPATQDKVAAEVLREWLATAHPEVYGDWTTDRLTASLRSYGIDTSVQVNRPGPDGQRRNLRGITRQSVADALTQRGRKPEAD